MEEEMKKSCIIFIGSKSQLIYFTDTQNIHILLSLFKIYILMFLFIKFKVEVTLFYNIQFILILVLITFTLNCFT